MKGVRTTGRRVNKFGAEGLHPQRATLDRSTHRVSGPLGSTQAVGLPVGDSAHPFKFPKDVIAFPIPCPGSHLLCPGTPNSGVGSGPHLAVHVGFGPDDVVVMIDDHGAAEHVQVLHHILLSISQCGDLCVVAWRRGWAMCVVDSWVLHE